MHGANAMTEVELAGQTATVRKGGHYDRFGMNLIPR